MVHKARGITHQPLMKPKHFIMSAWNMWNRVGSPKLWNKHFKQPEKYWAAELLKSGGLQQGASIRVSHETDILRMKKPVMCAEIQTSLHYVIYLPTCHHLYFNIAKINWNAYLPVTFTPSGIQPRFHRGSGFSWPESRSDEDGVAAEFLKRHFQSCD